VLGWIEEGDGPIIRIGCIALCLGLILSQGAYEQYETFEQAIQAGWEVD
jgi:hypothetical protein